jgi:hypothetical protein
MVGCPSKLPTPLDGDIEPQRAVVEFEHGLYCAVTERYGIRFWYANEAILRRVFEW